MLCQLLFLLICLIFPKLVFLSLTSEGTRASEASKGIAESRNADTLSNDGNSIGKTQDIGLKNSGGSGNYHLVDQRSSSEILKDQPYGGSNKSPAPVPRRSGSGYGGRPGNPSW
uniref:Hesp-937 n=1 Tax=Melampsora lini TaxID=5261 RepID=Q2MV31_MELLI|nr:hesp-937 [Melampsora lini]